jgi:hypothetical protein
MSLKSICLPASLEQIDASALAATGISTVTVENGNSHFQVSDNFLLSFDGVTVIRYFGSEPAVSLNCNIEIIGSGCFLACISVSSLTFESGSRLTRIESRAFSYCLELEAIVVPASVTVLCAECFARCRSLSSLIFEPGSKLSRIEARAFDWCEVLGPISIPASVTVLCEECFAHCHSISSLVFEPGSKLSRIEARAFYGCLELNSVLIPRSIEAMAKDWDLDGGLHELIFESSTSLRGVFESCRRGFFCKFTIRILDCDCDLDFVEDSFKIVSGADNSADLIPPYMDY